MNHTIDLYYFSMSPPSRAAYMLAKALGLKINIKIVNIPAGEQFKPEFLKLNPLHTIPVINDNGFVVYDSNAIMKYLVDQYARDDTFYPKDPKRGAIVTQRNFFIATHLFSRFGDYFAPVLLSDQKPNEELKKKVEESLQILDKYLESNSWVAGSDLTIADFSAVAIVSTIDATGAIELGSYINLWKWYQRCKDSMSNCGYSDNQSGSQQFGNFYKSKVNK